MLSGILLCVAVGFAAYEMLGLIVWSVANKGRGQVTLDPGVALFSMTLFVGAAVVKYFGY